MEPRGGVQGGVAGQAKPGAAEQAEHDGVMRGAGLAGGQRHGRRPAARMMTI